MAKQNDETANVPNLETTEVKDAPKVTLVGNQENYSKKVKIKLIKDLPKVYIAGSYYFGNAGDTLTVPLFVAYVLKGSDNKTEVFAV